MPKESPYPGPFNPDLTPYCIPIAEAMMNPLTRAVITVMGAQQGKSELGFNLIGQIMDDAPRPMLYVGPTKNNVQNKIEPRIMAMIRSAPGLARNLVGGHADKKTEKTIRGVKLYFGWGGSPTELASTPAAYGIIDDYDRMDDIKGEGSVLGQVKARLVAYLRSLLFINSTVTIGTVDTFTHPETGVEHWDVADPDDIVSKTWVQWQQGSREEWAVPCPECDEYFIPRLKLINYDDTGTVEEARKSTVLVCPHCGSAITDNHRMSMNAKGRFIGPGQWIEDGQVHGELINRHTRSFWVSGLMSNMVTWGDRVGEYVEAVRSRNQGAIQTAKNLEFGELYSVTGSSPDWEIVRACALPYKQGEVPRGVQRIYATVDVQKNRLVYVVRGWGYGYESWAIEAGEFYCEVGRDTSDINDNCWSELQTLIDREFQGHRIRIMAIDAGYHPQAVEAFALNNKMRTRICIGRDGRTMRFTVSDIEINFRGRKKKTGLKRWLLDHAYYKSMVYERLERPQDAAGAWHIPTNIFDPGRDIPSEDYCKQVTGETFIRLSNGRTIWEKIRDNHFLDCEYLQEFVADSDGVRNLPPLPEETSGPDGDGPDFAQFGDLLNG